MKITTPVGIAHYPYISKPDTQAVDKGYASVPMYKVNLSIPQEEAQPLVKLIKELPKEKDVIINLDGQEVQLVSHDKGKFGRILGELYIGNSNFSVNQQMIKEYHAVPYFGQSKDETEQGHLWNRAALNEQGIKYIK